MFHSRCLLIVLVFAWASATAPFVSALLAEPRQEPQQQPSETKPADETPPSPQPPSETETQPEMAASGVQQDPAATTEAVPEQSEPGEATQEPTPAPKTKPASQDTASPDATAPATGADQTAPVEDVSSAAQPKGQPEQETTETKNDAPEQESTDLAESQPPPVDHLAEGEALLRDSRFFDAEGQFLSAAASPEQRVRLAIGLTEIALRSGNIPAKRSFYLTFLTRSKEWRGVALLVLSGLAAAEQDWNALERNATLFLAEYESDDPFLYSLFYYLARYTQTDAEVLSLKGTWLAWFQACRQTPPDRTFPKLPAAQIPYDLAHLYLLEETAAFAVPPLPAEPSPGASFVRALLDIRLALNQADLNRAATLINKLSPVDKELGRLDLRIHHYRLISEFFHQREMPDRAARMDRNIDLIGRWAVLPLVLQPDHVFYVPVAERVPGDHEEELPPPIMQPEPDSVEETTAVTELTPPPQPDVSEKPAVPERDRTTSLETRILRGSKGNELTIMELPGETTYQKIYRNYLFGLHFINVKRLPKAFEHLTLAERLISDLPFPSLETKILQGLGRYYEVDGNEQRANWYYINATQIWDAPENLPIFTSQPEQPESSPYAVLLDNALQRVNQGESIHKFLLYSEAEHFTHLRRLAYKRGVLATNHVLANQSKQIGQQLYRLVDRIANNPSALSPKRYNETLAIWNQIWGQSLAYYRDDAIPSMDDIQVKLNTKDRLLAFVEGERQIGVLVISKNQAFALGLGSKANYRNLNETEKMDFLTGRLGPVWENEGPLYLAMSPTFKKDRLISRLKSRMSRPDLLRVLYSLKSFVATKEAVNCSRIAVIGEEDPLVDRPDLDLETYLLSDLNAEGFETILENHGHLVYIGPLRLTDSGLTTASNDTFYFHQIFPYHLTSCSLTLISQYDGSWGELLDELELIDPTSALRMSLGKSRDALDFDFSIPQRGLFFP